MKAKVHYYNKDDINTDEIIPARYLNSDKESELALHAMEDLDKDFVKKVQKGDIIVAKENFGCGSSREHAIWALRGAGVSAIIANTFARIFYRNALNNGFLAIECREFVDEVKNDDKVEISIDNGKIINITQNKEYSFSPIPDFAIDVMKSGGLIKYLKKN